MSVVKSKRGQGKLLVRLSKQGILTKADVDKCFECWQAHASKGNSYNLIKSMTKYYNDLWR